MTKIIGADAARLAGLQIDMLQKVRKGQMTLDQIERFNNLPLKAREERFGQKRGSYTPIAHGRFLRFVEEVRIDFDGRDLSDERVFPRGIKLGFGDEEFVPGDSVLSPLDKASWPTVHLVEVHEAITSATAIEWFGDLNRPFEELALSWEQIKSFCRSTRGRQMCDQNTYFLLRTEGELVIFRHLNGQARLTRFGVRYPCNSGPEEPLTGVIVPARKL